MLKHITIIINAQFRDCTSPFRDKNVRLIPDNMKKKIIPFSELLYFIPERLGLVGKIKLQKTTSLGIFLVKIPQLVTETKT